MPSLAEQNCHTPGEVDVEVLADLISRLHQSSEELTEEYRRLQLRVANLDGELEKSLFERERARAYLLSILESLKAGVLVLDQDLNPTLVNRRWTELAGEGRREQLTLWMGERLVRCLEQGPRDVLPLECKRSVQLADGTTVPVHLTISEIVVHENQRSGYVLVLQDVGWLKRLEAEAARTRRRLAGRSLGFHHRHAQGLGRRNHRQSARPGSLEPSVSSGASPRRRAVSAPPSLDWPAPALKFRLKLPKMQ